MSYSWARPGVKCVCVHSDWAVPSSLGFAHPARGAVYTIRDVVIARRFRGGEYGAGLALQEIVNPNIWPSGNHLGEPIWSVEYFRPLVTKTQKQDVAIFAPLLNTSRVDA